MTRKVWFQLVDPRGRPLAGAGSVRLALDGDMYDVATAVKAECPLLLAHTDAVSLSVFASLSDLRQAPLAQDVPVAEMGRASTAPLIVRVPDRDAVGLASASLPPARPLPNWTTYFAECGSLDSWAAGEAYKIPAVAEFLQRLGGCTDKGKLLWRQEDRDVALFLLGGWLRLPGETEPLAKKKSILVGAPGVGKSTLLSLLAFHAVLKHKKNVLVFRQRSEDDPSDNCLVYLGYDKGQIIYFTEEDCDHARAVAIYEALVLRHKVANVWLFLDGLTYERIPEGLRSFRMLTTSRHVELKYQERTHAYTILHPSWKKDDLVKLAKHVYRWDKAAADERFYYSGGSVREFARPEVEDIARSIREAVGNVTDGDELIAETGPRPGDRLLLPFVKKTPDSLLDRYLGHWEDVIDSEYAVRLLCDRLRAVHVQKLLRWARNGGSSYASLAESLFEVLVHSLAANGGLELFALPYDQAKLSEPKANLAQDFQKLAVLRRSALRLGSTKDYVATLKSWRDDESYSYWFPADPDCLGIDAIVKLECEQPQEELPVEDCDSPQAKRVDTRKVRVAYLQMTAGRTRSINIEQLKALNAIFYPDMGPETPQTEKPLFVLACPSLRACQKTALAKRLDVPQLQAISSVWVGCYGELQLARTAVGAHRQADRTQTPPKSESSENTEQFANGHADERECTF